MGSDLVKLALSGCLQFNNNSSPLLWCGCPGKHTPDEPPTTLREGLTQVYLPLTFLQSSEAGENLLVYFWLKAL